MKTIKTISSITLILLIIFSSTGQWLVRAVEPPEIHATAFTSSTGGISGTRSMTLTIKFQNYGGGGSFTFQVTGFSTTFSNSLTAYSTKYITISLPLSTSPGRYCFTYVKSVYGTDNLPARCETVVSDSLPSVTITSPANNALLTGSIHLTASASDSEGPVSWVKFYHEGEDNPVCTDNSAPFECYWSSSAYEGSTSLLAETQDSYGHIAWSASITIRLDNSAPSAVLTSPGANENVYGTLTFSATATDNIGVNSVQFFVDNQENPIAIDSTPPYQTTYSPNWPIGSSHTIYAKAVDTVGKTGSSSIISVVYKDISSPTITINSPTNMLEISQNTLTVETSASDVRTTNTGSGIAKVEFWIDDYNVGQVTTVPYNLMNYDISNWNWETLHNIKAIAYDNAGNTGQSIITVKKAVHVFTISGTVTQYNTLNPMSGIQIQLSKEEADPGSNPHQPIIILTPIATATTNSQGYYTMTVQPYRGTQQFYQLDVLVPPDLKEDGGASFQI